MGLLDGKVALITGAGGGIGRSHALLFAKEGAKVVVNDLGGSRDGEGKGATMAETVVEEIKQAGGEATANFNDVSERDGADAMIKAAVDHYGKLDILVNNAGILRDKSFLKMTDDMFDLVVKIHLRGTYLCTQTAAKHMKERGEGGRIINTSSVSGLMGNFGQVNYSAAKAGIYGITRTASIELRRSNITVNALAPVAFTRMTDDLPIMQGMPKADEILSPDHIANGALFLASDLSSEVTGQVLAIEGARIYLFKMMQTEASTPNDAPHWTPQEIHKRWEEISKI